MRSSKPFSSFSTVSLLPSFSSLPTVLFCSFLTIALSTGFTPFTGQNKAVAQENNSEPTAQNRVEKAEKKCTDKDVLALYKAVDELNIRVQVGINYMDFSKYYTDLVIGLSNLPLTEDCKQVREQIDIVRSKYNIARLLWQRSFRQSFLPVTHFASIEVLAYKPNLNRHNNALAVDDMVVVYLIMATEEFKKIKF